MSGVKDFLALKSGHNSGTGRWRRWGQIFRFCPVVRMDALAYSIGSFGVCFCELDGEKVYSVENRAVVISAVHGNVARGTLISPKFSREECVLYCYEGTYGFGTSVHEAFEDARGRAWRRMPLKKRIGVTKQKYPRLDCMDTWEAWSAVHLMITGSCAHGRTDWIKAHGHGMKDLASMEEFLTETASEYGNENIKKLREAYERD